MKNKLLRSTLLLVSGSLLLTACGETSSSTTEKDTSDPTTQSTVDPVTDESSDKTSDVTSDASTEESTKEDSTTEESTKEETTGETSSEESSSESSSTIEGEEKNYNIILAAATLPPVLAALDSIKSGDETYCWIERQKTFSAFKPLNDRQEELTVGNFHWVGKFDNQNYANGIQSSAYDGYNPMVQQIEDIVKANPKAHFTIYGTDYKVWTSIKLAFDAGLDDEQFDIVNVEDGSGLYANLKSRVLNVNNAEQTYLSNIKSSYELYEQAKEDTTLLNSKFDEYLTGYPSLFSLITKENISLIVQDQYKFESIIETKDTTRIYPILSGFDEEYQANIDFGSLSSRYNALSAEDQDFYLNLMFGDDRIAAYKTMNRSIVDGIDVPSRKLIFIGGRVRQSDTQKVTDITAVPQDYEGLTSELKEVFGSEADFNLVLNYINNASNYAGAWANNPEVVNAVQLAALNYYVEYTFLLKTTYRLYGDQYDILFKGHPSELVNDITNWGGYTVTVNSTTYDYKEFMFNLTNQFYTEDSEGKMIGILPGGIAAENLAYLGVEHVIGGLPSSTYAGYDPDVAIQFIYASNADNFDVVNYDMTASKYEENQLKWTYGDGTEIITQGYNNGKLFDDLADYYEELAMEAAGTELENFYILRSDARKEDSKAWIRKILKLDSDAFVDPYYFDDYGRLLKAK